MLALASAILAVALAARSVNSERLFTIVNRCPDAVIPYINGQAQDVLATNSVTNQTFQDDFTGLIYTNANGGAANGAGSTRAGFFGPTNYYYIVGDAAHLNTGVGVVPKVIAANALESKFCAADTCDSTNCPGVYSQPPTSFPQPNVTAPPSPLFECPGASVGYTVTFCPEKTFPPPPGTVSIHPNGTTSQCLDVQGAQFANGTPVQIYDCNGTAAQRWVVTKGGNSTRVALAGTNFCLDAGTNPANGTGMKIWTCFNNLAAQTWMYTDANEIKLASDDLCLDLPNGSLTNGNRIQTASCDIAHLDQVWVSA
ncbi:ricin B lectin domain-containing protein [Flammula alnicola]|nr:ricin B lectin domain-containing protein [Flammula alnicola]